MSREAYIYDAVRTPRGKGKRNGSLYEVKPIALAATALTALQQRTELDTSLVEDVVLGCVTPVNEQGCDIAKIASLYAGWDYRVSGVQLNRFCASGLDAVNICAMKLRSGWEDLVVAGGVESMSRVPMGSDLGAWANDPDTNARVGFVPQGVGADLLASMDGFSRHDVDTFAARSQKRAAHARDSGYFDKSIIPVKDLNGMEILAQDEFIRPETTVESLSGLRPAFAELGAMAFDAVALQRYPHVERITHVHTAGNSSGIVDGAAAVLMGTAAMGRQLGLKPRARVVAGATVGSEPTIMLTGPMPATRKVLDKAGMTLGDIDLFEVNEAFASVVLRFQREMGIDDDILNVNGGAIAMGHPLGATGAMLLSTLLDELERRDLSTGLITMCVGAGIGIATIIERV